MGAESFDPIAICGYSCKLPGSARDAEGLWKLCQEGGSAWSEIPKDRFDQSAFYHETQGTAGATTVKGGHFLADDVYEFDASFFNMSVDTAQSMDPVLRLQLESVFEAFEQAGITLDRVAGSRSAVYAASFHRDYHDSLTRNPDNLPRYFLTGNGTAMLSNRISHFFDLRGPSLTIDTGCSSSLTSLHTACRSLQTQDCDMAVVCGANLMLNPDPFISMSGLGLLSTQGRSRAFGAEASGYGRGEGVITLVLKRLSKAQADGDSIHAVIRGSASNQDGRTQTITSPSQSAQEELIKECYLAANLDPRETAFAECHGTGTKLGDLCEVSAIYNSFNTINRADGPLILGSVKTNIGHLEAGSGLAGIVKVIKAFEHNEIPPNHGTGELNPAIDWQSWNVAVAQKAQSWPAGSKKRASVNSFGYGGSNAHIILDSPELHVATTNGHKSEEVQQQSRSHLLLLSGNDEQACKRSASNLAQALGQLKADNEEQEQLILQEVSNLLANKRTHFKWRSTTQGSTLKDVVASLESAEGETKPNRATTVPRLGFVFTGQGAHWAGMAKELINTYPLFRRTLVQLDAYIKEFGASWSIIEELQRGPEDTKLAEAQYSMPVCCALQIALVVLLKSWGIQPSAITGHSSGESAAAFAAGALDMRSAIAVQYFRGLLTSTKADPSATKGGMLAVGLSPEDAQGYINNVKSGKVIIGCYNSPSSVTISGDESGIDELDRVLRERGVFARKLNVQAAFHSHHMERDVADYQQLLEQHLSKPTEGPLSVPLASSVTGTWIKSASEFGVDHWLKYMLQPVLFTQASRLLCSENPDASGAADKTVDILVEIGPHSALNAPLRQTLQSLQKANISLSTALKRNENALVSVNNLAGFLWRRGEPLDLATFIQAPHAHQKQSVNLPSYPWNHTARFLIEDASEHAYRQRASAADPVLGAVQAFSNPNSPSWKRTCTVSAAAWPKKLSVDGAVVQPQALFLSMGIQAVGTLFARSGQWKGSDIPVTYSVKNVKFGIDLKLEGDARVALNTAVYDDRQAGAAPDSTFSKTFQIHVVQSPNVWTLVCEGTATATQSSIFSAPAVDDSTASFIPVREGLLKETVESNTADASTATSVSLRIAPQSTGLLLSGAWRSDAQPAVATLPVGLIQSAIAAAQGVNVLKHDAAGERILQSIQELTYLHNSNLHSKYRSLGSIDANDLAEVQWTEDADDINKAVLSIKGAEVAHRPVSTWNKGPKSKPDTAHVLKQCRSLVDDPYRTFAHIPRDALDPREEKILLDLNQMCRLYFVEALAELRQNPPKRLLGNMSAYVQFMKMIEATSDKDSLTLTPEARNALRAKVKGASVNGQLVCLVGDVLARIIRSELDPLETMMQDRLLHRYYEEGLRWTRSYEKLFAVLEAMSVEAPRMDVLEIGAGTGGATTSVLQAFEAGADSPEDLRCASYTYTDISAGFFKSATSKFARYERVMQFKKLNIERELKPQAFGDKQYDLIVASQCLHATHNMRHTMRNVRSLLKPGGKLVLVETTKDSLDIQLFASCFSGWWLSEEPERKWSPSLSTELWQAVLQDSGFSGIDYAVKDCEDEELYAMQVLVSTAAPLSVPEAESVQVVGSADKQLIDGIQEQLGASHTLDSAAAPDGKPVVVFASPQDAQDGSWTNACKKARSVLVVAQDASPDEVSALTEQVRAFGQAQPSTPINVVFADSKTNWVEGSALSGLVNVLKTTTLAPEPSTTGIAYFLSAQGVSVSRAVSYQPSKAAAGLLWHSQGSNLQADKTYVVLSASTVLSKYTAQLMARLGAKNILVLLSGSEPQGDDLQNFSASLLKNFGSKVVYEAFNAPYTLPSFEQPLGGLVDFGDVIEDNDITTASSAASDALSKLTGLESADFNIAFAPLAEGVWPVKNSSAAASPARSALLHVNSIAFTDKFVADQKTTDVAPVEIHTVLQLLSSLMGEPASPATTSIYLGLPTSLKPADQARLGSLPEFAALAPRKDAAPSADEATGAKANGGASSLELTPGMSLPEKAAVIGRGIVDYISNMYMLSTSEIDAEGALSQYIDSLTAVQLRGWLLAKFRAGLTVNDISRAQSIHALADKVASRIRAAKA